MKTRNDSHCGLYCGSCTLVLARQRDKLKVYAKQWKCAPENLVCYGCRSEQVSTFCSGCAIRECARGKAIGFCIECNEYPCSHYKRVKEMSEKLPHLRLQPRELQKVCEMGTEGWLDHQKERWTCKECREMFAWNDQKCSQCGAKVKSSVDEVNELGLSEYPLDVKEK
jgi:hypothetical protein